MRTEIVKQIIAEWLEDQALPPLVRRDVAKLVLHRQTDIVAIVGPRRSGKTYYMYELVEDLLDTGVCGKDDILFVDLEDYRLDGFTPADVESLFIAFNQLTGKDPSFVFLDEIQHLSGWSRVLRTLHNRRRYRIVVSGSNSELLSREVSTELRGRYRDVLILPFSFREFLRFREIDHTERALLTAKRGRVLKAFDEYIVHGGFPEVLKRDGAAERRKLLQSYYDTIFYKDILERHGIRARHLLEELMRYCLNTNADLLSISAFEKVVKASGLHGSKRTISNYLGFLREAFFLVVNEKYSRSPRKRMMNPKKVFLLDIGFTLLATQFSENRGKALETLVAIELFRRQESMFYFKSRGECDFIIQRNAACDEAIQVCWEIDDRNRNREVRGVVEPMDELGVSKGSILTYDQETVITHEGREIPVTPVWRWLLQGES